MDEDIIKRIFPIVITKGGALIKSNSNWSYNFTNEYAVAYDCFSDVQVMTVFRDADKWIKEVHTKDCLVRKKELLDLQKNQKEFLYVRKQIWKNAITFYCDSVSWDGKVENMDRTGDGHINNPFKNVNHALKVIHCYLTSSCFQQKAVLHLSGTVDYPIIQPYSFQDSLIIEGNNITIAPTVQSIDYSENFYYDKRGMVIYNAFLSNINYQQPESMDFIIQSSFGSAYNCNFKFKHLPDYNRYATYNFESLINCKIVGPDILLYSQRFSDQGLNIDYCVNSEILCSCYDANFAYAMDSKLQVYTLECNTAMFNCKCKTSRRNYVGVGCDCQFDVFRLDMFSSYFSLHVEYGLINCNINVDLQDEDFNNDVEFSTCVLLQCNFNANLKLKNEIYYCAFSLRGALIENCNFQLQSYNADNSIGIAGQYDNMKLINNIITEHVEKPRSDTLCYNGTMSDTRVSFDCCCDLTHAFNNKITCYYTAPGAGGAYIGGPSCTVYEGQKIKDICDGNSIDITLNAKDLYYLSGHGVSANVYKNTGKTNVSFNVKVVHPIKFYEGNINAVCMMCNGREVLLQGNSVAFNQGANWEVELSDTSWVISNAKANAKEKYDNTGDGIVHSYCVEYYSQTLIYTFGSPQGLKGSRGTCTVEWGWIVYAYDCNCNLGFQMYPYHTDYPYSYDNYNKIETDGEKSIYYLGPYTVPKQCYYLDGAEVCEKENGDRISSYQVLYPFVWEAKTKEIELYDYDE